MANTVSNTRISNYISSQLPFFVRNDHPNFVTFLEKYYEYLEQETKTVNRAQVLPTYFDIDLTEDEYADKMFDIFMKYLPVDAIVDRRMILKHIKDFYRAKGTEKATKFLLRILYGLEGAEFYYPKQDVLKASDGKWFVQKSLRVSDVYINGVANTNYIGVEKFVGTEIRGNTTNASALVERVSRYYEQGVLIDELILSNVNETFGSGETIIALFDDIETANVPITANVFGGTISAITITNGGTLYQIGDPVIIVSDIGSGACAYVSAVSTGNVSSIAVISGGAGYQAGDYLLFSGGGGTGANGEIGIVADDNTVHPNSYNVVASTIELEANTPLNNAVYSNLNSSNVNTTIANAVSYWVYANTGPASTIVINSGGTNYTTEPTISVLANSQIQQLGILGRLEIVTGGSDYQVGDVIQFINVVGGYGFGALANVTAIDEANSNTITSVSFQEMPGQITGGSGYDMNYLPTANVISSNGTGANVMVTNILGTGAEFFTLTSAIGTINRITITNRGSKYLQSNTTIDLTGSGDGNATANVLVVDGVFSYPGRYLNDDGHLSSYKFLQDRDYYQPFSYVIRSTESISRYRKAVTEITHPAGMKLFGEYRDITTNTAYGNVTASGAIESTIYNKEYVKTGNSINISYTTHGLSVNANVVLEFTSGGSENVRNGIYMVTNTFPNYFYVTQRSSLANITIDAGGALYNANSFLVFDGDGKGANASYTVNANGGIVSVTINEPGIGFTQAPTVTANGTNSIAAVFTSTILYSNSTSGNVDVRIVL